MDHPPASGRVVDTHINTILLKVFRSAVALCFLGDTAGLQKGRPRHFENPSRAAPTRLGSVPGS